MIEVNNMDHADRIAKAAGVLFNMRYDHIISRSIDGELAGGFIFNGWNRGGSVNVHMAGFRSDWATPNMIKQMFRYCFVTLGVKKVLALVPSDNTKALEINRRVGFNQDVVVADVFADCDLVIMSMRRDECRWLPKDKK
jgi:RimJ/RimL family protein N-acetyltransferase